MAIFPQTLVDEVRQALDGGAILRRIGYRPEMIQETGDSIKSFCPIHKETIFRTLLIDKRAGRYRCSNYNCEGAVGGDLIDLYARSRGLGYEQALLELASQAGVEINPSLVEDHVGHALEVARNYIEMGVLTEAEEQFDQILSFKPDCIQALEGLVRIYAQTGRTEELSTARLGLARARAAAGHAPAAIELLKDHLKGSPGDHDARRFLIECLREAGQAEESAAESVRLAGDLSAAGEIDGALEIYRDARGMNGSGDFSMNVIELLARAGRKEEAVAECLAVADDMQSRIDPERAVKALRAAFEIDPTREDLVIRQAEIIAMHKLDGPPLDDALGRIETLLAARSHGPASQALDALIGAFPDDPKLISMRADLEEARGSDERAADLRLACIDAMQARRDYDGALAVLEKALKFRRDDVALLSRKANLMRETGNKAGAIKVYLSIIELFRNADELEHAAAVYQTIIDLDPNRIEHREHQLELYLQLGMEPLIVQKALALAEAWIHRGQGQRAVGLIARALDAVPMSPQLLERHGEILEQEGRRGEAAEQFFAVGRAYIEQQEPDRARQALEHALRCVPEHLEAREALADLLVTQEMTLQAMGIYGDLAEFHLRDKNPENVIRIAQKILRLQPDHMPTLLMLVKAYGQAGQTEKQLAAQMRLARLYTQGQSYTRATEVLEEILTGQEDCSPALEQLIQIAETQRQPTQTVAYLWRLSQLHARAGRREEEQAAIEQVLAKDPFHVPAWFRHLELLTLWATPRALESAINRFIDMFGAERRTDEAIRVLNDLCRDASTKPEIFGGLARLYKMSGDEDGLRTVLRAQAEMLGKLLRDDDALAAWDRLSAIQPDDLSILRTRIEIMMRNSMVGEVAVEYRRLASALIERGRFEEAEVALLEVLSLKPRDTDARDDLITIFIKTGDHERAIDQIDDAAAKLLEEGRPAEAITLYQRIFEFAAGRAETYRRIIAIRQRMGDLPGAIDTYGQLLDVLEQGGEGALFEQAALEAIALAPETLALRRRLADFYAAQGRRAEAESVLLALAVRQIEREQLDDAESSLARLLELNPDSVPARAHHAELMARRGRADDALAEFRRLAGAIQNNPAALAGASDPMRPFRSSNYEGLRLIPEYTFENFVVGARNNFAHATAMAVARAPARNYNPLFLYSDVGLGKTHLCHAIAHYLVDRHPELKIYYIAAEEFVGELIDAIQANAMTALHNRFKLTDVLILDDVQVLSGKERAQEEFFHIFNTLFQAGKQIVLTSDRPPKDIAHLERRLRSRFGAGIIVDIQSPDLETRAAILRYELRARGKEGAVSDEIILFIAEHIESNVRELKGVLNQVLARQEFSGEPIDIPSTREILARHLAEDEV
ncbi:MAG: DnaA/Hda family protein [Candidatus Sumerlaeia bacterium]